ncbi:rhodanese-like domain-containing protein [Nocardioides sp.]|uniref:rhodanese-like domain-containing protein n=1 Tax=Nocardioides sp. TaxID=35761 RepID=UPI002B9ABA02|nr:rhodanese-like domain-containing protein [Nocardioides sp.]HXH78751.1 rhodanese-like domain-containing protein [Nocardioides sp.]
MREVTIDDLAKALDHGATVVDVREPGEYAEGHVPGVVHIPMGHLSARVDELDRNQLVYVICASGNRSSVMTDYLTSAGFDAASVAGGTTAWARAGRPVQKG